MRSDPSNISRESYPESGYTICSGFFLHTIEDVLVWHLSVGSCLHLLHLGFRIVERKTVGGGQSSSQDGGSTPSESLVVWHSLGESLLGLLVG